MIVRDELRAFVEALAIGMWCRGAGHELVRDEVSVARRALADDLASPTRDLQALAAGIAGVTIMDMANVLNARGHAIPDRLVAELLETLPRQILEEAEIELGDDEEEDEETGHA